MLGWPRGLAAESEKAVPASNSDAACLECHSDASLTMKKAGVKHSLFVDEKIVGTSAHRSLSCVDCHEDFDGDALPHRAKLTPVDCFSCHDDTAKKHAFHPRLALAQRPSGQDTDCKACHGTHAVAAVKSSVFPFRGAALAEACGRCHQPARDHFTTSAHGRALANSEANAPDCLTCHRQSVARTEGAGLTLALKLAQTKQCESCHVGRENVAGHAVRGTHFVGAFEQSVHGAALLGGEVKAANCVDCHGAHEMNRAMNTGTRLNKLRVAETCGTCHKKPAHAYADSVHASALAKGNNDSATCTDCHGEHDIRGHRDPSSPVNAKNVAQQVCANCHASLRLTQKYGLPTNSFQTFADSYHGLAVRGGAVEVVNCASCHESHAIKSQTDPTSSIHPANLVATCGQCHPGANKRFTVGKVHVSPEAADGRDGSDPILHLIATLYLTLIACVVGGMIGHNALDFYRKVRHKLAIQKGLIEEPHVAHRLHLRMTAHERLQHGTLVLSFAALVVTGFMLRFPEAWWVVGLRNLSARAFEWRGVIHRVSGLIMLGAGVWHTCYLAFTAPGRALLRDLLPRLRDFTDPFKVLKYNIGLAPDKPKFGRFSYIEKVEYWAMMWGSLLMGVTGLVLWFENTSIGFFTKLGFDVARTMHFYEAILATLAIIFWHFYFVIFNPDIYPMNLSWLTGRMSEHEMLDEHPAELERIKAEEAKSGATDTPPPPPANPPSLGA